MTDPEQRSPAKRSRFAVIVLGGLAASGAAAVIGNRDWVAIDDNGTGDAAYLRAGQVDLTAPPVTATALVLLAAWGVLLVTRGRFRVAIAWLALVAALAVLGFSVAALVTHPGDVTDAVKPLSIGVTPSVWAFCGVFAGLVAVVTSARAVRDVRSWPEMGRRYDSPADAADAARAAADPARGAGSDLEPNNLDLWKAMDEGRDPTEGSDH